MLSFGRQEVFEIDRKHGVEYSICKEIECSQKLLELASCLLSTSNTNTTFRDIFQPVSKRLRNTLLAEVSFSQIF